jgi:hypothetical protein
MDRQGYFWDFDEDDPVHTLISWDLPGRSAQKTVRGDQKRAKKRLWLLKLEEKR